MRTLAIRVVLILFALVASFALGFGVASSTWQGRAEDAEAAQLEAEEQLGVVQRGLTRAQDRSWRYYREQQLLEEEIERLTSGDGTQEAPEYVPAYEPGTYGDGIHIVGEDIEPGDYDGVVTGEYGYWARLRATTGIISAIIANDMPRGAFVLTITPADTAVELRGVVVTAR